MEYTFVQREPAAFQQPIALEDLIAMCQQGLGSAVSIAAISELSGGQYNNTYLIRLVDTARFVLRVAPSPTRCVFWHEQELMRRERVMHSLLTPIAPLLPGIVCSDFTHTLFERDYMLLDWVDGVTIEPSTASLTLVEREHLWHQFGRLVRRISSIKGEMFGLVRSGPFFSTWSHAVLDWLNRTMVDAQVSSLDVTALCHILDIAYHHSSLLDEIVCPRLLHGDLWWFNMLVRRGEDGLSITAVLDADRGAWGDPLADWTFYLLPRRASMEEQALFWRGYGDVAKADLGVRFRTLIYEGLHLGKILSVATRDGNSRAVTRALRGLARVEESLQEMLKGDSRGLSLTSRKGRA